MNLGMITRTVKIDRGMKRAIDSLRKTSELVCKVGFPSPSPMHNSGKTVAQIALMNELGSAAERRPPRPFMQMTFDKNYREAQNMVNKAYQIVLNGGDPAKALKIIGAWYELCIGKMIETGVYAPLAPYTVAKKGHDTPLIDTKHMRKSVASKVVRK